MHAYCSISGLGGKGRETGKGINKSWRGGTREAMVTVHTLYKSLSCHRTTHIIIIVLRHVTCCVHNIWYV